MVSNPFEDGISVQIDGDSQGLAGALSSAKSNLGDFKGAALGVGAVAGGALVGGLKASVDAAASFEEAMIEVEKVTDPETAAAMGKSIKEMAEEMPIAQEELAGITEQAARLGIEGKEDLESYTRTAAEMATATDLTAEEAADSFARIGTLMDIPIEQSGNLGSAMNELANTMGTSSSEITDVMTRAGGAMNQLGVAEDEALALAGAMNEVSPSSRLAAGGMKRMSEAMMDPSNVGAFAEALGVTEDEFVNMRENDPSGTLLSVADASNESKDAADVLKGELGEAGSNFVTLGQNTDSAREATERAGKAWEENTSLASEAESAASTFSSQLQMVKNRFRNIAITVGTAVLPHLKSFLDAVTEAVGWLKDLNERLDGALLVGAVGAAIAATVPAIYLMTSAIATATAAAAPWIAALAAIGVAIGAVYWAVQNNFLGIGDLVEDVMSTATEAIEIAKGVIDDFVTFVTLLLSGDFAEAFAFAEDAVRDGIEGAATWLAEEALPMFKSAVTDLATRAIEGFSTFADEAPGVVTDAIEAMTAYMEEQAADDIKAGVRALVDGAVEALGRLKSDGPGVVEDTIEAIKAWASEVGVSDIKSAMITLGEGAVTALKAWFKLNKAVGGVIVDLVGSVATWLVETAAPKIGRAFKGLGEAGYNALADFKDDIKSRFTDAITAVYDYLTDIGARDIGRAFREIGLAILTVAKAFLDVGGKLYGVVEEGHQAIVDYLREDAADDARAAFDTLTDKIYDSAVALLGVGGRLMSLGKEFIGNLRTYFEEDAANDAEAGFDATTTAIFDKAKELLGSGGDLWNLVTNIVSDVATYFEEDAKDDLVAAVGRITEGLMNVWREFKAGLIGQSLIPETFEEVADYIKTTAKDIVKRAVGEVVGGVETMFGNMKDAIIGVGGIVKTLISEVASYLSGTAARDLASAARDAGSDAANALIDKFNQVLPDSISIPSVTIGGSIDIPKKTIAGQKVPGTGGSINVPGTTIGGQSIDIPQLQSGGLIEDEGLAWLHAGEEVVTAADVDRGGSGDHVDIDVVIEGNASAHEVERGLSRALKSYNIGR